MSTQEEFARLQLQFIDPTQRDYEIIRPLVLFGDTAAERSRQTGVERTVVGDKARRFVLGGMAGSSRSAAPRTREPQEPGLPRSDCRVYRVFETALSPHPSCAKLNASYWHKFGFKTNHHTLRRFLAPYETPIQLELRSDHLLLL